MKKKLRRLREVWEKLSNKERTELFKSLPKELKYEVVNSWQFIARPKQLMPLRWEDDYNKILWLTGRGFGKTRTAVETLCDFVESPPVSGLRIGAINKTESDARTISIQGESGFLTVLSRRGYEEVLKKPEGKQFAYTRSSGSLALEFGNGTLIQFFSAEKPDRFAGHQFHVAWLDEAFLWPKLEECWKVFSFCMRLPGMTPVYLITSTPRPVKILRTLMQDPKAHIVRGGLIENAENLSKEYLDEIYAMYDGTRWGKQEIYGEILDDCPDALWNHKLIEEPRIKTEFDSIEQLTEKLGLIDIVVAIDPAVTSGENSDETGIVVCAKGEDGRGYILDDFSGKYSPNRWADLAISAYEKWNASRLIVETNQGGDIIESLLRTKNNAIPYKGVRASKGKRTRAEPIAALYEQGKISHVGIFPKLEDQMMMFTPDKFSGSPDRVDALVWGLTELFIRKRFNVSFI